MASGSCASRMNSTVNANQGASQSIVSLLEGSIQEFVIVSVLQSDAEDRLNRILPAASADVPRTLSAVLQRFSTLRPANVNVLKSAHPTSSKIPTHVPAFAGRRAPLLPMLIDRSVNVWETARGLLQHQTATGLIVVRTTAQGGAGKTATMISESKIFMHTQLNPSRAIALRTVI